MKQLLVLLIFLTSCKKINFQVNNEPVFAKVQGQWSLQKVINEDNKVELIEVLGYRQYAVLKIFGGSIDSLTITQNNNPIFKGKVLSFIDTINEEKNQAFWALLDNQKYIFISRTETNNGVELKMSDFFVSKPQKLSGKQFIYNYKL